MYLRDVHAETAIPTLHRLIRENPLGIFTTAIKSEAHPFLLSSHIPFVLDADEAHNGLEDLGVLRGHLARQNPQSKAIMESVRPAPAPSNLAEENLLAEGEGRSGASRLLDDEVMVLFNVPVHHYVTPKFYVDTKPKTGKVVPTWNYAAAQVYGKARIYYDASASETAEFLSKQTSDLSRHAETTIMGYTGVGAEEPPWGVSDAPERYIQLLQKAIIGIEIKIERLEGKFKMSQESSQADRDGVVQGFLALESDIGDSMAALVKQRY